MADEVVAPAEATTEQVPAGTPAEALKTDNDPQEHMIPKSRFDAINDELKQLKKLAAQEQKQREAEAAEQLKVQGEYKTLYEKEQAKRLEVEQRAKALELEGFRRDVVARKNLPAGLAEWLKGETLEDLEANADKLLANLPKPAAPNINAGDASAASPKLPGGMTEAMIREQANRLGVGFEAFKAALTNGK
jgi:hypothetical protein